MAGYGDTLLRGMQDVTGQFQGQRRMQESEWIHRQNLERQYRLMEQEGQQRAVQQQQWMVNQRRMQQGMDIAGRQRDTALQLQLRGLQKQEEASRQAAAQREAHAKEAARGKLKPGYAWDPADQTKQTPIPGGPAWRELSSKHADDLQRLGAFGEIADASRATIERILDPKKEKTGFNSNFGGYNAALITQHMPGAVPTFGETQNVRNDLENLKSNLKAQGASLMRGVGGSPGSITEREWPILEKMIESLSPLMEEKDAREALGRISQRFEGMKQRSMSNYKGEWGDTPFFKAEPFARPEAGGAGTIPEGVDPRVWKFMTPAERKLWTPSN